VVVVVGEVVVVVAPAVVVVTPVVVVVVVEPLFEAASATALTMAVDVFWLGTIGVTPAGSKAIATRSSSENLMDAGFVVTVGLV
jgi:hypothetical protein